MKKISLLNALLLSGLSLAQTLPNGPTNGGYPVIGGPRPVAPIDTNEVILISVAVVLILAMVVYKKRSSTSRKLV